jgi:hypothetical protein
MSADDAQLEDGTYDAFVVWAEGHDDGTAAVDLTITTGAHRGDVVTVRGPVPADPITLAGLPCTLVVQDGQPSIRFS